MPKRILFIGILFCFFGLSAIWDMVTHLLRGDLWLNFGVLMLPVGIGLLRGRPSSRTWAKLWILLGYLGCACVIWIALVMPQSLTFRGIGMETTGSAAVSYALTITLVFTILLSVAHGLLNSRKSLEWFWSRGGRRTLT